MSEIVNVLTIPCGFTMGVGLMLGYELRNKDPGKHKFARKLQFWCSLFGVISFAIITLGQ